MILNSDENKLLAQSYLKKKKNVVKANLTAVCDRTRKETIDVAMMMYHTVCDVKSLLLFTQNVKDFRHDSRAYIIRVILPRHFSNFI